MLEQQYTVEQTVAPTEEPITLAKAKEYGWLSGDLDNAQVTDLISMVRGQFEKLTGLQCCTATFKQYHDYFLPEILALKVPLISVSAIAYVATDGTPTTWDAGEYQVDSVSRPGRIRPANGYVWPATLSQMNAVTITYTAGFGTAAQVPMEIKQVITQAAKYRFYHRDESNEEWLAQFLGKHWHGWVW